MRGYLTSSCSFCIRLSRSLLTKPLAFQMVPWLLPLPFQNAFNVEHPNTRGCQGVTFSFSESRLEFWDIWSSRFWFHKTPSSSTYPPEPMVYSQFLISTNCQNFSLLLAFIQTPPVGLCCAYIAWPSLPKRIFLFSPVAFAIFFLNHRFVLMMLGMRLHISFLSWQSTSTGNLKTRVSVLSPNSRMSLAFFSLALRL